MSESRFRVELAPAAQRQLRRLPPGSAAALRGPILTLGLDPRPPGASKLTGTDFWRLRVIYLRVIYLRVIYLRVIYLIEEVRGLVIVLRVARRSESTYRRVR